MNWLDNTGAAGLALAIVAPVAALVPIIPAVRWRRESYKRQNERAALTRPEGEHYRQRGTGALYELRHSLSMADSGNGSQKHSRLAARASLVGGLPETFRTTGLAQGERWLSEVGQFALEVSGNRVPLRTFLQTNHLAIIRQGAISEALLVWELSRGTRTLEPLYGDVRVWAMALRDLAIRYNSVTRHQRSPVFFLARNTADMAAGVIVSPPPGWLTPWLNCLDVRVNSWRLKKHRYRRARRRMRKASQAARQ